jgi:hypothetical protein
VLPVDVAGWLLRRLVIPENTVPWCLVVTTDELIRLAVGLLVRGPRALSVVCGLSWMRAEAGSKEVLDKVISDVAIPTARAMDGLMEVKWAHPLALPPAPWAMQCRQGRVC